MREADEDLWHLYELDMRQRRLSANTIANYRHTIALLSAALPEPGLAAATSAQVSAWLASFAPDGTSAQSAASHASYFRRARTFFAWAQKMELTDASPMAKMDTVREDSPEIPVPDVADIVKVLAACQGRDFRARRDLAMMRVMLETGTPRAAAIAGLLKDQVDMRRDQITVMDKGRRERTVPFGARTAHALTLYLRLRAQHPKAGKLPQLFLGKRGAMTRDGVYQVIEARCEQAGVPVISPHKWRHFTADAWFAAGGSEGDAMALFGWSTPAMAHRYARSAAARRAQAHAREAALADRV
ncbi:MAG TPA: tyrosine-type recombinase/integrase [Streptosporangiaceae bacterium]|nr:tyrosine-type recombinase/integrase [Streptosporangiaceae bacterium]